MYKKHPSLGYWVSEDGFLIKQKGVGERKPFKTKTGYLFVSYQGSSYYIHRLVYEAFYGTIPQGFQINHINGIKADNRLRNLEVVTPSENIRHAFEIGLNKGYQSESNSMAKLDDQSYYQIIDDIMNGESNDAIAAKYGLHSRYVSLIRGKKRLKSIWSKYELDNGIRSIPRSGDNSQFTYSDKLKLMSELPLFTNIEIATKYGIDPSSVSRIRSKQTWSDMWKVFEEGVTTN